MKKKTNGKRSRNKHAKSEEVGPFAIILLSGYYPTTCDDIPQHVCDPCEAREFGRIRSAGFINKDFVFPYGDYSNPTSWQNGILSGDILVIPATNGEMPEPAEKAGPGYGDVVEEVLNYDFQAKFNDPNFVSNCDFYNTLLGKRNFLFFFRTSSQTYITPVPVTIIPKFMVANDLNANVVWNVQVKWVSPVLPCPFNTPETIFDYCFELGN
jgi:hypothetical protein